MDFISAEKIRYSKRDWTQSFGGVPFQFENVKEMMDSGSASARAGVKIWKAQ